MDVKNYWTNKEENKEKAKEHYEKMKKLYANQIQHSIKNTIAIDENNIAVSFSGGDIPNVDIMCTGTTDAIFAYRRMYGIDTKIAALNFASYKNPGGKFLEGSSAQEESLCHDSILYNVLENFEDTFYARNRRDLNRGLYRNVALYSKDILFDRNDEEYPQTTADIITCAAPNRNFPNGVIRFSRDDNSQVLTSRTKFIFDIAEAFDVHTLILGAWGCGVFKQDPVEVAECFKELIEKGTQSIKNVVFAIPGGENLDAFMKVFVVK